MVGSGLIVPDTLRESRDEFLESYSDVPPELEENCPDRNRGRRVHELLLLPSHRLLVPYPSTDGFFSYRLSANLNPEHSGITRKFHCLTDKQLRNEFFRELVIWMSDQLPLDDEERSRPMEVGVHLIDYRPREGCPSVPTPNRLHRDGEPWVMIVLVHRQDVSGGESLVATDVDGDTELLRVTLAEPLDLILINDEAVFHHVAPIHVEPPASEGSRVALVVDITPLGKVGSRKSS
jgi:hypothetical protein